MAESPQNVQVIQSDKPGMVKQFRELLKEPIVQELVIPYVKKEALGIGGHEKNVIKGSGGRFLYGLRDLVQGTWWAVAGFIFATMLSFIVFLWLRKVLGV